MAWTLASRRYSTADNFDSPQIIVGWVETQPMITSLRSSFVCNPAEGRSHWKGSVMRPPRMTVRRWTVIVTFFALSLGVVRLLQQRVYYLRLVAHNARWEAIHSTTERGWKDRLVFLRSTLKSGDATAVRQIAEARRSIEDASAMTALFSQRRQIAERLATHPWEPVPPDPLDKKTDHEEPILIFEPLSGLIYEFSSRSIAILTLASIVSVLGYIAFRLVRKRSVSADGPPS
jgi:hypothetical protein